MSPPVHLMHVPSSFEPGGAQVRFTRIANALGPDFRYTIIAMDGNVSAAERLDARLKVDLLPPPADRRIPQCAVALRRMVLQVRPDLVITNNWGSMDAVAGALGARICPVIHSEDGFGPDEAVTLKTRRVILRRLLLRGVHTTVVPSTTLLRIAESRYHLYPPKVTHIPNAIDVNRLYPRRSRELRERLGAADDTLLIGVVGALRPEKAVHVLLEAFALVRPCNAKLIIVGDGQSRLQLETLAVERNIQQYTVFTGAVSNPEEYFAAFDLFAMSSATEQMPMALLEAMAFGLPAICTDAGDSSAMLGTIAGPVIVPIGDVRAYAVALQALVGNAALRASLGQANRNQCVHHYSFDGMVRAYATLYEQALAVNQLHNKGMVSPSRNRGQ